MFFSTLLAASALVSHATAFLVPLEISKSFTLDKEALNLALLDTRSYVINLNCPGCAFDTAFDKQNDYSEEPSNDLVLNFTIDDEQRTLALNGNAFYPLESPFPPDLYAKLVRRANGIESAPLQLGYALEYLPFLEAEDQSGTIVPIHVTIFDIVGMAVHLPSITVDLVKLPTGELFISKVDSIPFNETPGHECTTTFCRVKAIALARLREMMEGARHRADKVGAKMGLGKGCPGKTAHKSGHGSKPSHHKGHVAGHRRPHIEHGQHVQHHHRHHRHGLHKVLHQMVHLFVIPALLGIVGGLTASAIGMLVGQTIVFVWFRFVRGGRRGQTASARSNETALDEEKEALVDESGEAPPVYEETEVIEVVDEKN